MRCLELECRLFATFVHRLYGDLFLGVVVFAVGIRLVGIELVYRLDCVDGSRW